jgi:ABC-type sugar transport system permease subunit
MVTTLFALKLFVQPYLMTGGGPRGATLSVVQGVYRFAFRHRDLGLACAAGAVFLVVVMVVAGLQHWLLWRAETLA